MVEPAAPLTVCYNGACPVCRTEVEHYRRLAGGDPAFAWLDVAAEPDAAARLGVAGDDAFRRLHAVPAAGGAPLAGIDAFLATWDRLPRYRPLARLVRARAVRPVAVAVYERVLAPALFAWHRRRVARSARHAPV